MPSSSSVFDVLQALYLANRPLDAAGANVPLWWQNEEANSEGDTQLPDTPAPFIYTEYLVDTSSPIEVGGGRGRNRHRNVGRIVSFVFVPKGQGVKPATDIAEQIGDLLRPYNANGLTVDSVVVSPGGDGADLKPAGLSSPVDAYYYASVEAAAHSDQIG